MRGNYFLKSFTYTTNFAPSSLSYYNNKNQKIKNKGDVVVPFARIAVGHKLLFDRDRHVVSWVHFCRIADPKGAFPSQD